MQRRYRKPKPQTAEIKQFRSNERIKTPQVFLIDENGEKLGPTLTEKALEMARAAELDLVEVSPLLTPPVAKIMDYGQYKYETEKKLRKVKAHQKTSELKSIRLSFRIKGKDLETKMNQATKFLEDGNKIKIDIILKGREKAHKNIAHNNLDDFIRTLGDNIKMVQPITSEGGLITATLTKN